MNVHWLEQSLSNVPAHDKWLADSELAQLERLHIPKRRDDWRLGRWTAKRAVATVRKLPRDETSLKNIKILAGSSGAPEVYIGHQPAAVSISLSHRDGIAACAVALLGIPIGCDLELIEARSDGFIADYFTDNEQVAISQRRRDQRDQLATLLWSAKESALKALRVGLRADTRFVNIFLEEIGDTAMDSLLSLGSPNWRPFRAIFQGDQLLYGWWNASTSLIRTFASFESVGTPMVLGLDGVHYSPCIP